MSAGNENVYAELQGAEKSLAASEALRASEEKFAKLFHSGPMPIGLTRLRDGVRIEANAAMMDFFGYPREEFVGRATTELGIWVHESERLRTLDELHQTGKQRPVEVAFRTKQGHTVYAQTAAELVDIDGERCILSVLLDVTEQRRAQDELCRVNRALQTISHCNQALVRATSETELLEKICELIVESGKHTPGGYKLAWVGYAEQDKAKTVRVATAAGEQKDFLEKLQKSWADNEHGRGPAGTSIRTGQPVIIHDFLNDPRMAMWRESGQQCGFRSCIAMPLRSDEGTLGALTIYSGDIDAFDDAEMKLLSELVDDLAYGIQSLRAHARKEAAEAEVRKLLREAEASRAALLDSLEEQKRSATALRTSEEQFRSAMEYSPIGKAIVSTDGRWLQVNQAMCQIVGYSLEELLVRDFQSITHPDDLGRDLGLVQQMLDRTIESYEMEKRYFHKDGHIVWIQLNVSLVWNPDGTPRHFISQIQDITQRKRADAERSRLMHDLGKRVKELTALHRTARLLQQERPFDQQLLSEFVAFLPSAWQHPEICEARVCFADLEAKTPSWQYTPWMQSVDFRTRDQRAGKIEIAYREERSAEIDSPFVAEEQALLQSLADMLAAYVDRKTAEAALRQTQKLESLGTLAGGIAHDFNNILGAIISYTELTLQEHPQNVELQENLGEILKASQRAVSLVRQILTFSRRQKQERKQTQLGPVVQEVLKLMRSTLPATIEIRAEIAEQLPPVVADVTQIHQVLMNLCTNAAHAMRGKAGVLHVALSAVDRGTGLSGPAATPSHLQLTVRDTGHGMDAATLERIFDPFFTTKAPGEGTGLGLAMVHGIIKEHNGDIYTESKPGVGTTFRIELPVASSQKRDSTAPFSRGLDGAGHRLLFVDDEVALAESARRLLERYGFKVEARYRPDEALAAFQSNPTQFAAVITDLNMPLMTGTELAAQILKLRPRLPVFVMTGFAGGLTEEAAQSMGITALIAKPLDFPVLVSRLIESIAASDPAKKRLTP